MQSCGGDMKNTIITISRQYGSAGRAIGHQVAEKLGLECYDSQIITKIAEESGFDADYVRKNSETTAESGFFASLTGMDLYTFSNRDTIWILQSKIINELAEKGPCVIVGRCADYALAEQPNCIHLFIYADEAAKTKRVMERYQLSQGKARDLMIKKDKQRQSYYNYYSSKKWGRADSYDLCVNSSVLGVEGTVKLIAQYVEDFEKLHS